MLHLVDDLSATTHHDNSCAKQTMAQGVEIWSNSLSLMTFITHPSMQVPITNGTLLLNADPSGNHQEHHILIIPCHLFDLEPHNYKS